MNFPSTVVLEKSEHRNEVKTNRTEPNRTNEKVHDEAEDRRKEREAEAKSGGIDGLVMVPPSVTTRTQWLVTTVWRAEYLPVMDTGPLLTHGGDFYTMVREHN